MIQLAIRQNEWSRQRELSLGVVASLAGTAGQESVSRNGDQHKGRSHAEEHEVLSTLVVLRKRAGHAPTISYGRTRHRNNQRDVPKPSLKLHSFLQGCDPIRLLYYTTSTIKFKVLRDASGEIERRPAPLLLTRRGRRKSLRSPRRCR